MPSDDRIESARAAITPARDAFLTALATLRGEIEALLHAARGGADGGGRRAELELGGFAAGRLDADRFAALFGAGPALDPHAVAVLERARATLAELAARGDALFTLELAGGSDMLPAIDAALAEAGRVFGAARAAELARTGRFHDDGHEVLFDPLPQRFWSRAERCIAPPLVVSVAGEDLCAAALAPYLDGAQKIVLLVRGPAPPAPLAPLIAPGTLVLQSTDGMALTHVAAAEGPAIAAWLPEGAAVFAHDPRGGASVLDRLRIESVPARAAHGGSSACSAWQRRQQLALLEDWRALLEQARTARTVAADAAPAEPEATPADRLAGWLLAQAGN
jgi:hypothetical protein